MAALTYRNSNDERADKAQQERLLIGADSLLAGGEQGKGLFRRSVLPS
jgi:hypothetical protein